MLIILREYYYTNKKISKNSNCSKLHLMLYIHIIKLHNVPILNTLVEISGV
jgi:hypothetical protein